MYRKVQIQEGTEIILGYKKSEIICKKEDEYISEILFKKTLREGKKISGKIVEINGWDVVLTMQFVAVNCAALPENLLESELFGYEKGAFTGADSSKPGLFELAHNGTLFLDEISEISPKLQTRLLRVLEEREVMRVGGERIINVDVRIITSSNKNLKMLVKENNFRRDLYYRLSVLPLKIPSLNERKEDIIPLIKSL